MLYYFLCKVGEGLKQVWEGLLVIASTEKSVAPGNLIKLLQVFQGLKTMATLVIYTCKSFIKLAPVYGFKLNFGTIKSLKGDKRMGIQKKIAF